MSSEIDHDIRTQISASWVLFECNGNLTLGWWWLTLSKSSLLGIYPSWAASSDVTAKWGSLDTALGPKGPSSRSAQWSDGRLVLSTLPHVALPILPSRYLVIYSSLASGKHNHYAGVYSSHMAFPYYNKWTLFIFVYGMLLEWHNCTMEISFSRNVKLHGKNTKISSP